MLDLQKNIRDIENYGRTANFPLLRRKNPAIPARTYSKSGNM